MRSGIPDHWLERNDLLHGSICGISDAVADDPNFCEEFRYSGLYGQLQSPDNVPDSNMHLNGTELEER